jgi:hypothetical protein
MIRRSDLGLCPAALLSGAQSVADLVPLSKEVDRMIRLLQARKVPSEPDALDELTSRHREKVLRAGD